MKVIFLDIDGVLNSDNYMHELIDKNVYEYENDIYQFIDENAVNIIVDLCKQYDLKLVITSSWRHFNLSSTIDYFKKNENKKLHPLIPYIIDVTPRIFVEMDDYSHDFVMRGEEIYVWLMKHPVDNYVILDDDSDMLDEQILNFIQINRETGLTNDYINNIKEILKL